MVTASRMQHMVQIYLFHENMFFVSFFVFKNLSVESPRGGAIYSARYGRNQHAQSAEAGRSVSGEEANLAHESVPL